MKIGVIIGRFQIDALHAGHTKFLNLVGEQVDKTVVLLGVAPFRNSKNPLSFDSRKFLLESYAHLILPLYDRETNKQWTADIDSLLSLLFPHDSITLFHSRNGFGIAYSGKYPVKCLELPGLELCSASRVREGIAKIEPDSRDWREGFIAAEMTRFKAPTPCVDIAFLRNQFGSEILLGKKAGEILWRLPGGVVDSIDENYEAAARRELFEETGMTVEGSLEYIGSFKVNDWRNRDGDAAIFTTLYSGRYVFGNPKANDDLVEVQWKPLSTAAFVVMEGHKPLISAIIKKEENGKST